MQLISLTLLEALPPGSMLHLDKAFLVELGIQWLNTIILTAVLSKVLYKPVKKMLEKRAEHVEQTLSAAAEAESSAISMKKEYEGKLGGVEAERAAILDEAKQRAAKSSEALLAEARRNAEQIRSRAAGDIRLQREQAKENIRKEIIDISTLLAGRLANVSIDRQANDKLIDETISELGDLKWQA
ncbi:MAG: F0F1 ATP synthase subunit B [Clostridiales bacterium]|jgi:F-type H+-transporting ATPase subunit b|nr:F0F1 ATP synthase subunit B [Clostridiales bacterium]